MSSALKLKGCFMEIQFVTDASGNKTAAIVPFDEWERMEEVKDILEHVYLSEIIRKRKQSKSAMNLNDLLKKKGLTRADLES
jgi:dissimilatory sulfite reductase (desulfoviridin) alpha/beta subunit